MEKNKTSFEDYRRKYYLYTTKGRYVDVRNNEFLSYEEGLDKYKKEIEVKL